MPTMRKNPVLRGWAVVVLMLVLLAGCDSDVTDPVPTPAPVASVEIGPKTGAWTGLLEVGQTFALAATPRAADGSALPARVVEWASTDTAVATVTSAGVVEARREGGAEITATIDGKTGRERIQVTADVHDVVITPAAAVLEVGATAQYAARAFDRNGNELEGRPVAWSTSTSGIVSVSATGLVTALSKGYGQVSAIVEGVSVDVGLTVTEPESPTEPVASVIVVPRETAVYISSYVQLRALTQGPNGGPLEGRTIHWTSENPLIAQVGVEGMVLGVTAGTARIRAESEGKVGYATVHVRPLPAPQQAYDLAGTETLRTPWIEIGALVWRDSAGTDHDAYRLVTGGALVLDAIAGRYTQSLTVETYLIGGGPAAEPVETRVESDEGILYYDYETGQPILRSTVRPALELRAEAVAAGEYVIPQSVLGTPSQRWLWIMR